MRKIIAPVAGFVVLTCGSGLAWAASPAYCALYAKEFAKHAAVDSQGSIPPTRIRDRAYHKCLNLDDEPILPTAYTDPTTVGSGGPFLAIQESFGPSVNEPQGGRIAVEDTPAEDIAALSPEPPPAKRRSGKRGTSGYAMWSREWRDWCRNRFPNSFDPKTGTVVPYKTRVRTICR